MNYSERIADAVSKVDAISADDPEAAHAMLDEILSGFAPPEVRLAAARLRKRCRWWAAA